MQVARCVRRWRLPLLAVAIGGALFGVTTAVQASIPDNGVIHGCYGNSGGLRVIDNATEACKSAETALNWNQQGPTGPRGTTGPKGSTGAAGAAGNDGTNGTNGKDGASGPTGATGATGPSDGYHRTPFTSTPLTTEFTNVVTLDVPAGSDLIWGTARLFSQGTGATATCALRYGTTFWFGDFGNVNLGAYPDRKMVTVQGATTLTAPATLALACLITVGDAVNADEVSLSAIKVGTLHVS